MRLALAVTLLALSAAPALADPFSQALDASDGRLCFKGVYAVPTHPGRVTREALLSFNRENRWGRSVAVMRLSLKSEIGTWHVWGSCDWMETGINRGVDGRKLISEFPADRGLSCHAFAGADEEGGDFPIEWRGADRLTIYTGDSLAARRGFEVDLRSENAEFERRDRVLVVERVDAAACADLVAGLDEPVGYPPE